MLNCTAITVGFLWSPLSYTHNAELFRIRFFISPSPLGILNYKSYPLLPSVSSIIKHIPFPPGYLVFFFWSTISYIYYNAILQKVSCIELVRDCYSLIILYLSLYKLIPFPPRYLQLTKSPSPLCTW